MEGDIISTKISEVIWNRVPQNLSGQLYLQGSRNLKSCVPETSLSKRKRSFGIQASLYLRFSIFAFPQKLIKPCTSAHWTYKHFSPLTELTATMNLNSEMHKRSICFNSCFYIEVLEFLLSRQLPLIVLLSTILCFFSNAHLSGNTHWSVAKQKDKTE